MTRQKLIITVVPKLFCSMHHSHRLLEFIPPLKTVWLKRYILNNTGRYTIKQHTLLVVTKVCHVDHPFMHYTGFGISGTDISPTTTEINSLKSAKIPAVWVRQSAVLIPAWNSQLGKFLTALSVQYNALLADNVAYKITTKHLRSGGIVILLL